MLDILQQKLLSWSPDKADQFFNNMPRFVPVGGRIWETTRTGYFLYDSTYSAYFDYNGKVYSLGLGDSSAEYTKKQELSNASVEHNSIAIERPDLIQPIEICGMTYTYVEETRPYNSLGIGGINLSLLDTLSEEEGIALLTSIFSEIKNQLKNLATAANQPDYSEYIDVYEHVYYDPDTEKYFLVGRFTLKKSVNPTPIFDQYISKLQESL